jgi:hypothetical protein
MVIDHGIPAIKSPEEGYSRKIPNGIVFSLAVGRIVLFVKLPGPWQGLGSPCSSLCQDSADIFARGDLLEQRLDEFSAPEAAEWQSRALLIDQSSLKEVLEPWDHPGHLKGADSQLVAEQDAFPEGLIPFERFTMVKIGVFHIVIADAVDLGTIQSWDFDEGKTLKRTSEATPIACPILLIKPEMRIWR